MATGFSEGTLREIQQSIETHLTSSDAELQPSFYAVSGSHLYGFPGPDSDIDIRGFHCAPGVQYMLFDEPKAQVSYSTTLRGAGAEIDVVSRELRTFGEQLRKGDFTAIEPLYADATVQNVIPNQVVALRSVLASYSYGELPVRYLGMAESVYKGEIVESTEDDVQHYLYVLRGALAAQYVEAEGRVEPNLNRLIESQLDESDVRVAEELLRTRR
jgi:predicted nucleotidyltransferase